MGEGDVRSDGRPVSKQYTVRLRKSTFDTFEPYGPLHMTEIRVVPSGPGATVLLTGSSDVIEQFFDGLEDSIEPARTAAKAGLPGARSVAQLHDAVSDLRLARARFVRDAYPAEPSLFEP